MINEFVVIIRLIIHTLVAGGSWTIARGLPNTRSGVYTKIMMVSIGVSNLLIGIFFALNTFAVISPPGPTQGYIYTLFDSIEAVGVIIFALYASGKIGKRYVDESPGD